MTGVVTGESPGLVSTGIFVLELAAAERYIPPDKNDAALDLRRNPGSARSASSAAGTDRGWLVLIDIGAGSARAQESGDPVGRLSDVSDAAGVGGHRELASFLHW